MFRPHKVHLLPVCDGAGGAQLLAIPAWLSATSFTGISRSIPLKTAPSQRHRARRQRAQHPAPSPAPKRPVSGFTLKTFPSEQILSPDAPACFIQGWAPCGAPRKQPPIRCRCPMPCAGCWWCTRVRVCVDTPPRPLPSRPFTLQPCRLFPASPAPAARGISCRKVGSTTPERAAKQAMRGGSVGSASAAAPRRLNPLDDKR